MRGGIVIMSRVSFLIIVLCFSSACNTGYQGVYTEYGEPVQLKVETEPSQSTSKGECLADTLSFLVGQPETALAAMEYPANTRVFPEGQEVNIENNQPSRLNLVIGSERKIVNIFCG